MALEKAHFGVRFAHAKMSFSAYPELRSNIGKLKLLNTGLFGSFFWISVRKNTFPDSFKVRGGV
ncbi:hypothetical protein [Leptolyngbya sp. FACHB-16]|uniref:hypothetical protein n=1 Tax=Leptolyngbya sp. PL-A3 TaxID=2933911 RepID=UPI0016893D7D